MEYRVDVNKLIEKVKNVPVGDWKEVENSHKESYYFQLVKDYQVLIYRDWVVDHGKPEWTGGNSYGLSIVTDSKIPTITELSRFENKEIGMLFQRVSEFNSMRNQKELNKIEAKKRKTLSDLISKL